MSPAKRDKAPVNLISPKKGRKPSFLRSSLPYTKNGKKNSTRQTIKQLSAKKSKRFKKSEGTRSKRVRILVGVRTLWLLHLSNLLSVQDLKAIDVLDIGFSDCGQSSWRSASVATAPVKLVEEKVFIWIY